MICKNSHTGTDSHLFLKGCLNSVPIHILSFPSVAEDVEPGRLADSDKFP